jgi:hypothetical protein
MMEESEIRFEMTDDHADSAAKAQAQCEDAAAIGRRSPLMPGGVQSAPMARYSARMGSA